VKIEKIEINFYKSISKLTIPMPPPYAGSQTVFLLGLNESGKSNILEAMSILQTGFGGMKFDEVCHKTAQEKEQTINICAHMSLSKSEQVEYKNSITELFPNPTEAISSIEILAVKKNAYLIAERKGIYFQPELRIGDRSVFEDYVCIGERIVSSHPSEYPENPTPLTEDVLARIISRKMHPTFEDKTPIIISWRPSEKYLITSPISLQKFKEDISISVPLANIFRLHNLRTSQQIKDAIQRALSNDERKSELQDKLSNAATRHIKSTWKEHKVNIIIRIDGGTCKVHVEDADSKHSYYNMNQRSDGFKQFISLLLTLSAQNNRGLLENRILLLDEPEAYLHPSGARFMRDEILKIGKNNHVFAATHSPSMVDNNARERHWIVQKEKMETSIRCLEKGSIYAGDEILDAAFGINVMKELLPENLIYVEGDGDKQLIEFAIGKINQEFLRNTAIRPLGGAGRAPSFIPLLTSLELSAYILLDADKQGRSAKRGILEKHPSFRNKVWLLTDLVDSIPTYSTIEDLIPRDVIRTYLAEEDLDLHNELPDSHGIIRKIKDSNSELRDNEDAIERVKRDLISKTMKKFSSPKKAIGNNILKLAETLIAKIEQDRNGPTS